MGSKQQKDDTVSKRTDATEMLHVPAAGDLEMAQDVCPKLSAELQR